MLPPASVKTRHGVDYPIKLVVGWNANSGQDLLASHRCHVRVAEIFEKNE